MMALNKKNSNQSVDVELYVVEKFYNLLNVGYSKAYKYMLKKSDYNQKIANTDCFGFQSHYKTV